MTHAEKVREAYIAWEIAEVAYQAELVKKFGNRAGDERFTLKGKGENGSPLRNAWMNWLEAGEVWKAAVDAENAEVPA